MQDYFISGYSSFNKPLQLHALKVCYLTQNLSQFHLACMSCIGSRNNYIVFNPDKDLELHVFAKKFNFDVDNTRFCFEVNTLRSIINSFDVIITTVGHHSPVMNKDIKALIDLSVREKIPIIDVPHGLFQFGHNFWDDSQIINLASSKYGAGGWVDSFCGSQINWFRNAQDGPGYPRYNSSLKRKQFCVPEFTLLTTNSNWYLYDSEWQRTFLAFLTDYSFKNLDELIIWSPHPAELVNSHPIKNYIDNLLPPNVFVYGGIYPLKFYGVESTEDLIACCKKGITTVSTCLLDYELNDKDVLVLSSDSTDQLVKTMKNVVSINLPSEFKTPLYFSKPETGYLFPYNVESFDQLIISFVGV